MIIEPVFYPESCILERNKVPENARFHYMNLSHHLKDFSQARKDRSKKCLASIPDLKNSHSHLQIPVYIFLLTIVFSQCS